MPVHVRMIDSGGAVMHRAQKRKEMSRHGWGSTRIGMKEHYFFSKKKTELCKKT